VRADQHNGVVRQRVDAVFCELVEAVADVEPIFTAFGEVIDLADLSALRP
jgi:hypothetical protein